MPSLGELFFWSDAALALVLVAISVVEVRTGSIPNLLVLAAIVIWLAVAAFTGDWWSSLGGAGLAFVCAVTVWQKGWLGGGVAKAALPIGGLLGVVGAAVVVGLAVLYALARSRRDPGVTESAMPRVSLFAILFVIGRVAATALRG